jgi:hypothetical protein
MDSKEPNYLLKSLKRGRLKLNKKGYKKKKLKSLRLKIILKASMRYLDIKKD